MKSQCVLEYNAWMKGVDLGDQLAASYPSVRKSLKWYKNLFFNMYDLAVINTFSIYKFLGHGRVDQADFRMDLAIDIINHYVQQREPHSTRGAINTPITCSFCKEDEPSCAGDSWQEILALLPVLQSRQNDFSIFYSLRLLPPPPFSKDLRMYISIF